MTLPNVEMRLHVLFIHRRDATEGYAAYLTSEGFKTTEANSTDEGVKKAIAEKPDLIVLDFDLDGETTARLKAHITTCGIPVIALAKMAAVRSQGRMS